MQILKVDAHLCNASAQQYGTTPLMTAASAKQAKFVLFLLMLGRPARSATACEGGRHAVGNASAKGKKPLQKAGKAADHMKTHTGEATASESVPDRADEVVVDAFATDSKGQTALHHAALVNDTASIAALLSTHPQASTGRAATESEHNKCVSCSNVAMPVCKNACAMAMCKMPLRHAAGSIVAVASNFLSAARLLVHRMFSGNMQHAGRSAGSGACVKHLDAAPHSWHLTWAIGPACVCWSAARAQICSSSVCIAMTRQGQARCLRRS